MQRTFPGIILFLFGSIVLNAQETHFFNCIQIMENNAAQLSWEAYQGNDFLNYEVFHSENQQGPYQEISTQLSAVQNTYLHTGIDAVNNNNYYFIRINKSNSDFQDTDTLQALKLRVVPVGSAGSIGWLRWNPMHDPQIPGSGNLYSIYRKYSYGNWELIGTTSGTAFYDTILVCRDLISYKVELQDVNGCISLSNSHEAFLTDHTQPPIPVLDTVSINEEGYAMLGWEMSPDSSVVGYKILKRFDNGLIIWDTVASINGIGNTSWVDFASDPCNGIEYYKILSVDSCSKLSGGSGIGPGLVDEYMQSIFLEDLSYNPCSGAVEITWTPYINMRGGLKHYEILMSKNASAFELLATVPADSLGFIHADVDNSALYEYFIKAVSNTEAVTASSCKQQIATYYPGLPEFIYLNYASVIDEKIHLRTYVDTAVVSQGFIVERAASFSGPYQVLDTLQPDNDFLIDYTDSTANPSQQRYYYRVIATDSCGKQDLVSNTGTNILLQIQPLQNRIFEFTWNAYEDWDAGVQAYHFYRLNLQNGTEEMLQSLQPGVESFQINLDQEPGAAEYGYFIEAVENEGGEYNFGETARSNVVNISIEAKIFMPNAFAPARSAETLKPVFSYLEGGTYQFRIFSRWGQLIFETTDPGTGWDGRFKGDYAPMGAYYYTISYSNPKSNIMKKGSIMLIY